MLMRVLMIILSCSMIINNDKVTMIITHPYLAQRSLVRFQIGLGLEHQPTRPHRTCKISKSERSRPWKVSNLRRAVFLATASRKCPSSSRETACGRIRSAIEFLGWSLPSQGPQPLQLGNLTRVYLTEGVAHLLFCGAHHGGNILGQVAQLLEHFHHLGWIQLIICLHPFSGIPGPSAVPWQSSY